MEYLGYYIGPLIGGIILYLIINAVVKSPGNSLQSKFVKLGTLKGKTLKEITAACGQPNSVSAASNENKVMQWIET